MNSNDFVLIMPVSKKDVNTAIKNITFVIKYINPLKIVIISDSSVLTIYNQLFESLNIEFMDENSVLPGLTYNELKTYLNQFHADERTGWYFQQFLKMAYSLISPTKFYVSWDADTVPLKQVEFFDSLSKPIFSLKDEYNSAYFDTIYRLFGIKKQVKGSFICEHMIFNTIIMQEMIKKIAELNTTKHWFYNIIDNISIEDLKSAGFSEFETYGTYVYEFYRDCYSFKNIKSLRTGRRVFGDEVNNDVLRWLSDYYDTVSFEKWDDKTLNCNFHNNDTFRKIISPNLYVSFYNLLYKLRNFRKVK